jgi:uncharacterized damage-inducible protein DinB
MQMQPDHAKVLQSALLPQIQQEAKTTRRVIEAIPADKSGYRPDPKARTAMELAWHLAAADVWFLNSIANGNFDQSEEKMPAEIKKPADIGNWYDKHLAAAADRVAKLSTDQLAKTLNFYNVFNYPAVMYLSFTVNHSVHHRGQLSTYIRPMGGKVPSIYGGSADEPFEMPQTAKA